MSILVQSVNDIGQSDTDNTTEALSLELFFFQLHYPQHDPSPPDETTVAIRRGDPLLGCHSALHTAG